MSATPRSKRELTTVIRRDSRVVLVVNARSRRAAAVHPRLAAQLDAAGVQLKADLSVSDPTRLPAALARAVAMSADLIIVGGGDGTLATAVRFLAHQDIALGVLPLGTTNNFARSLGVPLDVPSAVATIGTGKVADVDLGRVDTAAGGDLFANLTSLGLSVEVARRTPHTLKRRLGRAAYALTALYLLPRHRPFHVTITSRDGRRRMFWTHQLNIANGGFHAGRRIATDASVDDRLLVLYRLGDHRRRTVITAAVTHALAGARRRLAGAPFLTAVEVRVATDPPLEIDVDGEILGGTPIRVSVDPEALRVLVPQDVPDPDMDPDMNPDPDADHAVEND